MGQIGAAGVSDDTGATIPLSSTTNLATDTAVGATIDRVDANGVKTPTLEESVIGVVSGSNLINCVRGAEGTAQAHAAGAVVEILVTAKGYNDIIDHLLVGHTQLGAHTSSLVTTLKATGAVVNTGTSDVTIVTPKAIADSNIPTATSTTTFTNKTLTSPLFNGSIDGWVSANETWTYASASTITVPSGAAAKYAVGDRIKWTQTTVKYGVITAVADTVLTILVNTSYTVATPTAITDNYYSHQISPIGYPGWFSATAPSFNVNYFDNGSGGQATTTEIRVAVDGRTFKAHYRGNGVKAGTTNILCSFTVSPFPAIANSTVITTLGNGYTTDGSAVQVIDVMLLDTATTILQLGAANITDNVVISNNSWTISYEI